MLQRVLLPMLRYDNTIVCTCAAVCCSVLQCVAVCCSVLHCVAACCSEMLKYDKTKFKEAYIYTQTCKYHIYRSLLYVSFSIYTSVLTYIRLMYRFLGLTLRLA